MTVPASQVRPRDAASLVLIDNTPADGPKILMGRRSARHAFMAGVFVFPGGGVDRADSRLANDMPADQPTDFRLLTRTPARFTPVRAEALKLAAIRECFEETGYIIGRPDPGWYGGRHDAWQAFQASGHRPDPTALSFVARAITPPGRVRRFDARFFAVAVDAHQIPNGAPLTDELTERDWYPLAGIADLQLADITRLIVEDIAALHRAGQLFDPARPKPFYFARNGVHLKQQV